MPDSPPRTRSPPPARPDAAASARPDAAADGYGCVPFHGRHQAGIRTGAQRATAFVSFDTTADGRAELADLSRTLTDRARFLTAGGTPDSPGITAPPPDSGTLGPQVPADRLTVTVGVGASLFDDRYGLAARTPYALTTMQVARPGHTVTSSPPVP